MNIDKITLDQSLEYIEKKDSTAKKKKLYR